MKYGFSFFSFDRTIDFGEAMKECKNAGFEGVELVLSHEGDLRADSTEKEVLELKKKADDVGIQVISIGDWDSWDDNLATNDPAERSRAMDKVKKQIDFAAATGADTALVVPGYTGTPFASTKLVSYDVAYEYAQKSLSELSSYAKAANVTIAIEEVWNKFLLSPIEMARFLDEINSPSVKAYFDIGNIIYVGYPEQWIRILGKRIHRMQFDDCRSDGAGLTMFVDLFEGDVNYPEVMKAIHEIGYDDWAVIEFFPGYRRYPYQSAYNAKLSLDTLFRSNPK